MTVGLSYLCSSLKWLHFAQIQQIMWSVIYVVAGRSSSCQTHRGLQTPPPITDLKLNPAAVNSHASPNILPDINSLAITKKEYLIVISSSPFFFFLFRECEQPGLSMNWILTALLQATEWSSLKRWKNGNTSEGVTSAAWQRTVVFIKMLCSELYFFIILSK